MAQYSSNSVTGRLGEGFYALVKTRPSVKEYANALYLDKIADTYPDQRNLTCSFNWLLSTEIEVGPPQKRLPDSPTWLKTGELEVKIGTILADLPYAVKLNTWGAACEEWLQICNIDWVKSSDEELAGYPAPPSDNEGIIRWMPRYVADTTWFY